MEFKDKFIGFVDIIGWRERVKAAEAGTGMSLAQLKKDVLSDLGTREDETKLEKGPLVCPQSSYVQRNLDFKVTQITDSVIVSAEISPAGVINLVHHCWLAVLKLLTKGIMCRGYISRGSIYHKGYDFDGSGYHEVVDKEKQIEFYKRNADERGTPFVEVDQSVCDYVENHGDSCIKMMFSRFVKKDGNLTALFPFQRLHHSFIVGNFPPYRFDAERERQSNENVRSMIKEKTQRVMALVNQSRPDAVSKAEHYIKALDAQLEFCKRRYLDSIRAGHSGR